MGGIAMADSTNRDYADALIVLQSLYGSVPRLAVMGPVCEQFAFFRAFPVLEAAFEALYGFFREYNEFPTPVIHRQDLETLGREKGVTDVHLQSIMMQALEWMGKRLVNDGPAEDIMKAFRENAIRSRLRETLETDHLQKAVDEVIGELRIDPFQRPREENPFSDPAAYLATTKPHPFGVTFMDVAMNGGAQLGETVGLIAPSGGGKTTIGLQVVERQVYEGRHVIYIATEQKLKGDLSLRTFVLATGMTRADWSCNWRDISPRALELYKKAEAPWRKYFHFYDVSRIQPTSIDALYAPVQEQIEKGNQPVYVIIDWWGDVRDALIEALTERQVSEAEIRRRSRGWLKEVVNKASELRIVNFALHQLSGKAARKSAESVQSSHDAQEDSNFNNRMDFAFTFSKKASNGRVLCHVDKARRFRNETFQLKLDGDRCRFSLLNDAESTQGELTDPTFDGEVPSPMANYLPTPKKGID